MNVTDLMIGDIVLAGGKPIHVTLATLSCGVDVKPMPLTVEILEKNWHGSGLGWYDVFMMWEGEYDEHNFVTKFFAVRDAYRYPHLPRFSIIKDDKDNVIKEIKYVHELQHWLKVLGIEKEIVV